MSAILPVLLFLLLILLVAGRANTSGTLRVGLYVLLIVCDLAFVYVFGLFPASGVGANPLPENRRGTALLAACVIAALAFLFMLRPVRVRLQRIFTPAFDPDSLIQMTALVFCVFLFGNTVMEFVLSGGLGGLAEDFKGVTLDSLALNAGVFVAVALVGAGFPTRRSWGAVWRRLGVRWPTLAEFSAGLLMAFGLVGAIFVIGLIWTALTPRNVVEDQTQLSRLIANSVNTVTLAFAVALSAAVGEEIAFRGALQPIFGLWPTAIFFALTHVQYTLTPAALVIIVVGLGLGWIRKRYNTTVSIVTHFTYNFALLFLTIYGSYLQEMLKAKGLQ
jgi:hypothetical protein